MRIVLLASIAFAVAILANVIWRHQDAKPADGGLRAQAALGTQRKPLVMNAGQVEEILNTDPALIPAGVSVPVPAGGGAGNALQMASTSDPTAAVYGIYAIDGLEAVPVPYYDRTWEVGYNWNGVARPDLAQSAQFMQFESKFWNGSSYRSEFHLSSIGTDGIERRVINEESATDGSYGNISLTGTTVTMQNWDSSTLATFQPDSIGTSQLQSALQISSNSASNILSVKSNLGAQKLRVGQTDMEIDIPVGISAASQPVLLLENPLNTNAGSVELDFYARGGAKTALIVEGQDGNWVFRNNAVNAATYFDVAAGGFHMRNSSFVDSLGVTDAGNTTVLGTIKIGGSSGSTWSNGAIGAGPPGINCAIGDLFSNTTATLTTNALWVCTSVNTWTAK